MPIKGDVRVFVVVTVVGCYASESFSLLQNTTQSASYPTVFPWERVSMCMLEVFKPSSLDWLDPFNDFIEAVSIAALRPLPDLIPEFLDALI